MEQIEFSSDTKKLSLKDVLEGRRLAEKYFKTKQDPNQIPATIEVSIWVHKNIPESLNMIKHKGEIIGFSVILPCSKRLMEQFLSKKINEAQLFGEIKKSLPHVNFDAIYLCAAFIKPEFRHKGLAQKATVKLIENMIGKKGIKPILFYWKFSKEGEKLASIISQITGLELRERS